MINDSCISVIFYTYIYLFLLLNVIFLHKDLVCLRTNVVTSRTFTLSKHMCYKRQFDYRKHTRLCCGRWLFFWLVFINVSAQNISPNSYLKTIVKSRRDVFKQWAINQFEFLKHCCKNCQQLLHTNSVSFE